MDAQLRKHALAYLAQHNVVTLATVGPEGPWAAAVFYANEGFDLYFLSLPRSRHATNIAARPRVAAAIQEDYRDWPEIKGIQLEGRVAEVTEAELTRVRSVYGAKFPVVMKLGGAPRAIAEALAKIRWYRLRPDAVYFIDNSAGFGQRKAVPLLPQP